MARSAQHKLYDAVGNRLMQETHEGTNTYAYDIANHLIDVDGIAYTWDANGNLLDDVIRQYSYDHTNRLTGVIQGGDTYAFAYNGLGDRLQQTVNGEATNYTLDLVTGLMQVLGDGTNAYLYDIDRIGEEQVGEWQYHLGDALGSVRQLTNSNSGVVLTQSYQPFGNVLESVGAINTSYGFTGEWVDSTGLVHLRFRYYQSSSGRFITRDTWTGNSDEPMSFNYWLYVYSNPINQFDPTGMIPTEKGITEGTFVYSCNCGWIDFSHANPALASEVKNRVNSLKSPSSDLNIIQGRNAIKLGIELGSKYLIFPRYAVVKTTLSEQARREVALGIFMEREELRETIHSLAFWSKTGYSEEDLASDLIGFYMAINDQKAVEDSIDTWNWLSERCNFPKDKTRAMTWSLDVLWTYPDPFEPIKVWGEPRLLCSSAINEECRGNRHWPREFSTITPQRSSSTGNWWWHRGILVDGLLIESERAGIYHLEEPGGLFEWAWGWYKTPIGW